MVINSDVKEHLQIPRYPRILFLNREITIATQRFCPIFHAKKLLDFCPTNMSYVSSQTRTLLTFNHFIDKIIKQL